MAQGMEKMMEGMHGPPPRQLYPSLIELPDLPPEKRDEVQRAAHERMTSGTELMAQGLDQLVKAAPTTDYAAMQGAIAKLREGLARFDSGLAAHRALAEGKEPRALALQWFKGQLNLPGPPAPAEARRLWGLSWEHLIGMALLIGFAAVVIAMYFFKMRRAARLLQALTTAPPRAWGGSLRVTRVFGETAAIKTFRLVDPTGGPIPFGFLAGQFVTLAIAKDGRAVKRSYTIASSPAQRDYIELTVKREEQGLVSRHLHDEVREGALLQVAGPQGVFTFTGTEAESIVLIGAGVGATPLMSIVRYLTDRGWGRPIDLVLSYRTPKDFLFREELEYLQRRHPNLRVTVTMSRTDGTTWSGPKGRLTREFFVEHVPFLSKRRVHICGPTAMMDSTRAILLELGIPRENIRTEAFGPAEKPQERQAVVQAAMAEASRVPAGDVATGAQVKFTISGKTAPLPPDTTVLEAAEHVGVAIDASCRAGTCGTCKVRLLKGSVTMAVQDALSPEDKGKGLILACQAQATEGVEVEA
jgi:ferredoxin-NADP reductase